MTAMKNRSTLLALAGALALFVVLQGLIAAEVLTAGYVSSTLRDAVAFGILIVVLMLRPTGLLGKRGTEKV